MIANTAKTAFHYPATESQQTHPRVRRTLTDRGRCGVLCCQRQICYCSPKCEDKGFTAEMGPVFNIMPDKSFRPMSVNAWFNIFVMCQKKWFPQQKKQTDETVQKTNRLWGSISVKYREII